jgi:PadR family transcriptional regulator PadR
VRIPFRPFHDRPRRREQAILRALADGGELHGLALARAAGLKPGTIHPELVRLETAGLIASRWEDPFGPQPRRRVYQLTDHGRQQAGIALGQENRA